MLFVFASFLISAIFIITMVVLKARELKSGNRSPILKTVAIKFDPLVGRLIDQSKFFSREVLADIFRFIAAKIGLWTAGMLVSLRNFSSKLAAHLYHTSRKAQSGDPIAAHPSFFIKAILDFKNKLGKEEENNRKT